MRSGRTLWDELCHRYSAGVAAVAEMRQTWEAVAPLVDAARAAHVRALLAIQEEEARWWRNACLLYFQTFSQRPLPPGCRRSRGRWPTTRPARRATSRGSDGLHSDPDAGESFWAFVLTTQGG